MSIYEFLNEAKNFEAKEKYIIIESLIQDLNHIDKEIEQAWIEESQKRLELFEAKKLETVSYEEVFGATSNF